MKRIMLLLFILSLTFGQTTDKTFADETSDGVVVVVITSKWSEGDANLYVNGLAGHEGARIITASSEDTRKVCKKLRFRNFPSIALFVNGDKVDTWKGDMDGVIEVEAKEIKEAIDDAIAGDVF